MNLVDVIGHLTCTVFLIWAMIVATILILIHIASRLEDMKYTRHERSNMVITDFIQNEVEAAIKYQLFKQTLKISKETKDA